MRKFQKWNCNHHKMSLIAKESSKPPKPRSSGPGLRGEAAKDSSPAGTRAVISSHRHSWAPRTLVPQLSRVGRPFLPWLFFAHDWKGLSMALRQRVTGSPERSSGSGSRAAARGFWLGKVKWRWEPKMHVDAFPSLAPSRANVNKALARHRKVESSENFSGYHYP